ncbi:uncharacterized protein [Dermacentor albipictus]|uniref:uncharacterized protein isoform X1 n=1 Tax=Dermacentor albipictus TaxID=60249 RepID=UPI0038FC590F
MRSIVATLILAAVALRTAGQQREEELPFDDLMATICRKYETAADRKDAIMCVGDRMEIELEAIVTECLQRQYRLGKISDQAFDMLCDDDSRKMDRVYDCVDDQADSQGGRDWTLDEVTKYVQVDYLKMLLLLGTRPHCSDN